MIDEKQLSLSSNIHRLFQKAEEMCGDLETLSEVLALAPEIEAYRGKGSQSAARQFSEQIGKLIFNLQFLKAHQGSVTEIGSQDEEPHAVSLETCLLGHYEVLSNHLFARTQGPPVRSSHAVFLRELAWDSLGQITEIYRRPEHLAHAFKVAADGRVNTRERLAAVKFIAEYCSGVDCDEATDKLLITLTKNAPDRHFLTSVLSVRIDLDLESDNGAMKIMDVWDDDHAEE